MSSMNFKSTGIGKGAQYIGALDNMLNSTAVILLIQEIAGLLAILQVNIKL
jgi:hypothetical protein